MAEGRFITFEGGEGTGKSTQVTLLAEKLRAKGLQVVVTREPGGTPAAELIRELLVSGETERWTATSEVLLNYAAREDHLIHVIRPALKAGSWIICDRFVDSTRAYQGVAGGADGALIAQLEQTVLAGTWPHLTFILDLEPGAGLHRAGTRNAGTSKKEQRFESKSLAFHEDLRSAFLDIAAQEPERCCIVDAAQPLDIVEDAIWRKVVSRLQP